MKNILIVIALITSSATFAEEQTTTDPAAAMPQVHTMQNSNPATPSTDAKEKSPEHVMNNANPSPKEKTKKAHTMKNN